MKKIFSILIIGLLFLTGCNNENVLDLDKVKIDLENISYNDEAMFSNNTYYTKEKIEAKYGVDLSSIDEYIISMPSIANKSNMYIIVSYNDKVEAKKQINDLFDLIKTSFSNGYAPIELDKIENKYEKEYGKYLIYIVSDDNNKVYNEIID